MNIQDAYLKAKEIEKTFFNSENIFIVSEEMESIPLVAANIHKATRSFSEGQLVFIYDGYWGMAERVKVIGRYRKKHRFICGVCPIKNLSNYRPKIVHQPAVVRKLVGTRLDFNYFRGFLDRDNLEKHIFVVKNNLNDSET